MARRKANGADADDDTEGLVNRDARNEAMTSGFARIYDIEREIARLTAQHLESLKGDRTRAWRTLKADLNIPRKVLSVDYAKYKLAREAIESGDQETIDHLKEIHEALHPGQTVDWVSALDAEDQMAEAVAAREAETQHELH